MAKLTAREAAEKHARRLKGSTEDIRRGVERVQEAPGVRAAQKQDKMRANLIKAVDSGKWAERVSAVPLGEWKGKMINKGVNRIAQGVDEAMDGTTDFFGQLFEHQDKIKGEIDAMPDLTLDDNINKAVHNMRRMSEFRRK